MASVEIMQLDVGFIFTEENNSAATDYAVVLVTASSQEEGKAIAHALVEAKLAACVTLMPVHSIYTWQG